MQIDLDSSKRGFHRLMAEQKSGKREKASAEILTLLQRLWEHADLTPDDAGWVLWNTCDWYALARDAATQHKYQTEFFNLVKGSFPERAHWVVSDATQAMTLIHGGFLDFWWGCYQFANTNAPRVAENRGARFEAHRANAASYAHFGEIERAESALESMASLLKEDPQWANQAFARVTHRALLVRFYAATGQPEKIEETGRDLEWLLNGWLDRVGDPRMTRSEGEPLLGSWQSFIADRPAAAVFIGVHNAACEFAKAERFESGERLFRILRDRGRTITRYGEALFLQSCWRNRHDRDEIIRLLDESKSLTREYLIEVVPELADVVEKQDSDPSTP